MMKKHWKNKGGVGNLALVISTLIISIVILLVAMMVFLPNVFGGLTGGYDPPLKEGDTEDEFPIFAYFAVSAHCRFDNSQIDNHVIYGMDSVTATVETASTMQAYDPIAEFLDYFSGHDAKYTVQFKITGPAQAGYSYTHSVSGTQNVGAMQQISVDVSIGSTPGIRYEGKYHVTATLIDGGGGIVSQLDKDVQVSK